MRLCGVTGPRLPVNAPGGQPRAARASGRYSVDSGVEPAAVDRSAAQQAVHVLLEEPVVRWVKALVALDEEPV